MKKVFLTLMVFFSLVIGVNAQDVGQMWVGGSFGISGTSIKDGSDHLDFKVIPEFGYVVSDKMGVGVKIGFQQEKVDLTSGWVGKTQSAIINPFIRYSVMKGNIGGLFIDGGLGYAYGKDKYLDIRSHAVEVGFRPGVSLNVSEKIALTAKFGFLGYQYLKLDDRKYNRDNLKLHNYGFDFDLDQVLFGVSFVF